MESAMTVTPADARLDGKVAVVTGAAQGIGEASALALAAFGADVAICDRNGPDLAATAEGIRQLGRRTLEGVLDVRDEEAVGAWLARVGETFGKVDILVNNAGGGFHAWFLDVTAKGQTALVNENFTSVTTFIRGCAPLMPDGGSIINVTSIEAHRAAPGFAVYASMKAAVEELTRTLSVELSDRQIRVNTIAPDAIPTGGDDHLAAAVGITDDMADFGWKIPLGLGTPDDCAGAIVWLAGGMSRFVSGSTVHVDGASLAAAGWRRRSGGGGWEP
jgi:3-oxoacyl-[acyl-carrier protein] reductase